jgi:hypothetical protein
MQVKNTSPLVKITNFKVHKEDFRKDFSLVSAVLQNSRQHGQSNRPELNNFGV